MPLKTVHLTNAWHRTSGGIRSFYLEMIRRANEREQHIRMIVPGPRTGVEEAGRFGKIYYIESASAPLNPAYRMISPRRYLAGGSTLVRILNAERPDVVEICDKYTLPYLGGLIRIGKLPGFPHRPLVLGLSCERMDENMGAYISTGPTGRHFCRTYMKGIYFPQCDHHLTVSQHAADELAAAAKGHKVRRGVWLAPMGVDTGLFTPARRTTSEQGAVRLLYAGRLVPEKNIGLILNTVQQLRDKPRFKLLIAGTGSLHSQFAEEALRRAPGMVTMLGHVDGREALADLYANCDIFLHPNPREPFGIAPLEAMASGMALVAPNSGGVTTYANSLNSWLVEPSGAAFARAIEAILAAPEESMVRRRAARVTAEKYSWNTSCDRFFRLYEELHAGLNGTSLTDELPAAFHSTPGNWLGQEVKQPRGHGLFTFPK